MKPIYLEIRHLKTILAVKEAGSVSLAAKQIHLTQSALSHQLKMLEDQFELALFERKTHPLRFTPAGERLVKLAQDILPRIVDAEMDLARIRQGDVGMLRIAVECHTCFDWLMPPMDTFRKSWGMVELDIVSGFHTDTVGLLLGNRADWAVVSEKEEVAGIHYEPLFSYEMVGICSKGHPLVHKKVWEAEDFRDETLIHYPVPDDMLDLMRKVLQPEGINPARRTSELTIAIIQLVSSKRGIAVLPYWTVKPYLERGYVVARKITQKGLYSNLYSAIRERDKPISYIRDFHHTVKEVCFDTLPDLLFLEE